MKTMFSLLIVISALLSAVRVTAQDPNLATAVPGPDQPLSSDASFFYDQLAPYGQWLWIDPYGWVWSPNNVDASWRPYSDGRWVYADCGWTWDSDLAWGWAPFHYGRWFFHEHRGWCWVPGSEWAPAWVAWHWGDNACGWAPLPPAVAWQTTPDWDAIIPSFGWCFIAPTDFGRAHLHDHLVLAARNITLLRETRNVTHFELRNNALFNLSITAEQIEKATHRAVPRLHITEMNSPGGVHGPLRGKTEINFYRPKIIEKQVVMPVRRSGPDQPAGPAVTFDQLRRDETAHRELESTQARERQKLEQVHQAELRKPPAGMSAPEVQERHQAEHQAFEEHVTRQNQVFDHQRQASPPSPPPQRSAPVGPQRPGGSFDKRR